MLELHWLILYLPLCEPELSEVEELVAGSNSDDKHDGVQGIDPGGAMLEKSELVLDIFEQLPNNDSLVCMLI